MKSPFYIRFVITLITIMAVCVIYRYFWNEKMNLRIMLIALSCALSLLLIIKLPGSKTGNKSSK